MEDGGWRMGRAILHPPSSILKDRAQRQIIGIGKPAVPRRGYHMGIWELGLDHRGATVGRGIVDHPDVERAAGRAGLDRAQTLAEEIAGVEADDDDSERGHHQSSSYIIKRRVLYHYLVA